RARPASDGGGAGDAPAAAGAPFVAGKRAAPFAAGAGRRETDARAVGSCGCSLLVHLDVKRDVDSVLFGSARGGEFSQPPSAACEPRADGSDRDVKCGSRLLVAKAAPVAERNHVLLALRQLGELGEQTPHRCLVVESYRRLLGEVGFLG